MSADKKDSRDLQAEEAALGREIYEAPEIKELGRVEQMTQGDASFIIE